MICLTLIKNMISKAKINIKRVFSGIITNKICSNKTCNICPVMHLSGFTPLWGASSKLCCPHSAVLRVSWCGEMIGYFLFQKSGNSTLRNENEWIWPLHIQFSTCKLASSRLRCVSLDVWNVCLLAIASLVTSYCNDENEKYRFWRLGGSSL